MDETARLSPRILLFKAALPLALKLCSLRAASPRWSRKKHRYRTSASAEFLWQRSSARRWNEPGVSPFPRGSGRDAPSPVRISGVARFSLAPPPPAITVSSSRNDRNYRWHCPVPGTEHTHTPAYANVENPCVGARQRGEPPFIAKLIHSCTFFRCSSIHLFTSRSRLKCDPISGV